MIDGLELLERISETGTAPERGCSLFGVGYEDAFERLDRVYIDRAFGKGRSAEKFVVGPFGSGKTHFIRQLMELASRRGCVTSEVALNRDIDFTKSLFVYKDVTRELRCPDDERGGIARLLEAAIENVQSLARTNGINPDLAVSAWVEALASADLKEPTFARVARHAFQAHLAGEHERFEAHARWLGGEVDNREICKTVGTVPIPKAEQNRYALSAMMSLGQLIHRAGFTGTVIAFDEAEQSFNVGRKLFSRILSMLQSGINATADLREGSLLIVFAVTPDIIEAASAFPALQQRISDPGPGMGFFDGERGNTRAAKIDLSRRPDLADDLCRISRRLVDLLFDRSAENPTLAREVVYERVDREAREVAERDSSASGRREVAKRVATLLVQLAETGSLDLESSRESEAPIDPEF